MDSPTQPFSKPYGDKSLGKISPVKTSLREKNAARVCKNIYGVAENERGRLTKIYTITIVLESQNNT